MKSFSRIVTAAAILLAAASAALAQTSPGLIRGQVPTAAQWNSYFASKQDTLGFSPVNKAGDIMLGKLNMQIATTVNAGLNLGLGAEPTTPVDGDVWITPSGMYAYISGSVVGPFISSASGSPGGTVGQLQYNAGGVFGGFTMAGDCTVSQPNITCTKTGGVNFAASATTNTTNASNISSGTLAGARMSAVNLAATGNGGITGILPAANVAQINIGANGAGGVGGILISTSFPALTGDITTASGTINTSIVNNAVSNNKLAQANGATLKGNPTAVTTNPSDFTLAGLTSRGPPDAANDLLLIWDSATGTLKNVTPQDVANAATAGVTSLNQQAGDLVLGIQPQGRLTLTSGTPVMTTSVPSATTVYYSSYVGKFVPIYNGTALAVYPICAAGTVGNCQLSVAMGSNWVSGGVYDFFVGLDSGTIRLCSGPAWTSDTVRGAATTLQKVDGILVNQISMTCRYNNTTTFTCAPNECTYLGSMRTIGAGTTAYTLGGSAAGGDAAFLLVWNMYNRVDVSATVRDSTGSWSYGGGYRSLNGSTGNRVWMLRGLDEDGVYSSLSNRANLAAGTYYFISIALDATTGPASQANDSIIYAITAGVQVDASAVATYNGNPGIGVHYLQAIEQAPVAPATVYAAASQGFYVKGRF